MKTDVELVWKEKYDIIHNSNDSSNSELSIQIIEHVDFSLINSAEYQSFLPFFNNKYEQPHIESWSNFLIQGDNKLVVQSLLQDFEGKIDLIYIDPPFNAGINFSIPVIIGENNTRLEYTVFRDAWSDGLSSYLQFMYNRLLLMKRLLSEKGSIWVHLDQSASHYVKVLMDEIFGIDNFLNEIVWKRYAPHSISTQRYDSISDHILVYSKVRKKVQLNPVTQKLSPEEIEKRFPYIESETGRRYQHASLEHTANRSNINESRIIQGKIVTTKLGWIWSQQTIDERLAKNPYLIHWTENGRPRYKIYADEYKGRPIGNVWDDIPYLASHDAERSGYPTQKPEALLERIIFSSTNEGDLVADFFCGSGTTLVVAEKLNRRWIGVDFSQYAIHTARKRIINLQEKLRKQGIKTKPFTICNLGSSEQKWWLNTCLRGDTQKYKETILRFYGANPTNALDNSIFHGKKESCYVYVHDIESTLDMNCVFNLAKIAKASNIFELHILIWKIEPNLVFDVIELEKQYGVNIKLRYIPREIMESNCTKVQFLEPGLVKAEAYLQSDIYGQLKVHVRLLNFRPSFISLLNGNTAHYNFWDFIDVWGVDFTYNSSRSYKYDCLYYKNRGNNHKKKPIPLDTASLCSGYAYEKVKNHTIAVKVIDLIGVDTTIFIAPENIIANTVS